MIILLAVKTNMTLVTVMLLGFFSRPELVISYLPPGMASKINTKGKRLYMLFIILQYIKTLFFNITQIILNHWPIFLSNFI